MGLADHSGFSDAEREQQLFRAAGRDLGRSAQPSGFEYSVRGQLLVEAEQARREVWLRVPENEHSAAFRQIFARAAEVRGLEPFSRRLVARWLSVHRQHTAAHLREQRGIIFSGYVPAEFAPDD